MPMPSRHASASSPTQPARCSQAAFRFINRKSTSFPISRSTHPPGANPCPDTFHDASPRDPGARFPSPRYRRPHRLARRLQGRAALLVIFLCNHCPYVKHVRTSWPACARNIRPGAWRVVGISSNDVTTHPDDSPAMMAREKAAGRLHVSLPLRRVSGRRPGLPGRLHARLLCLRQVAKAGLSRPDGRQPAGQPDPGHGQGPAAALDAVLAGKPPASDQRPSMGCNIKWKPRQRAELFLTGDHACRGRLRFDSSAARSCLSSRITCACCSSQARVVA